VERVVGGGSLLAEGEGEGEGEGGPALDQRTHFCSRTLVDVVGG
jgi:hypothetical protein